MDPGRLAVRSRVDTRERLGRLYSKFGRPDGNLGGLLDVDLRRKNGRKRLDNNLRRRLSNNRRRRLGNSRRRRLGNN